MNNNNNLTKHLKELFKDDQLVTVLELEYYETIQTMILQQYSDREIAEAIKAEEDFTIASNTLATHGEVPHFLQ